MLSKLLTFVICLLIIFTNCITEAKEIFIQQTITQELCQQLIIDHVSTTDTEYQPGIDIEGNTIAAADLEASLKIKMPKTITIPLRLGVKKFLDIPKDVTDPLKEQADLGVITFHRDGRLYYGDQPLFVEDQRAIEQACQKIMLENK